MSRPRTDNPFDLSDVNAQIEALDPSKDEFVMEEIDMDSIMADPNVELTEEGFHHFINSFFKLHIFNSYER